LHKPVAILVAAFLASLAAFSPAAAPAAQAAGGVKVAIIVGATHGTTPRYREDANEVYAEAIKYTSNVVRVYSPNATAPKVKAAVNGASIIVYLGHGNGWPSPYTYDPNYTTKDGFGLNADLNNDGRTTDYENKYYGEPWIRDLNPAPNAVVLLFHLCYASGNSEPGDKEPSLATAKKRVDNYAAAFIKAGAGAVIASGHSHDPYYISGLFTTRQTIEEYWRNSPDANGNVAEYASARNPGYAFQMDPDRPGSYYRSLAGKLSLRTPDVTGAPYADTSRDPATIVVPGSANPAVDGAPVFGSVEAAAGGSTPATTLTTAARVRIDAREWATSLADGSPVYRVHTDTVEGWMTGSALIPRDSAAPQAWEVDDGSGTFSPNGDGSQDAIGISVRLSETAAWTLRIEDGDGDRLHRADGASDTAATSWSPAAGSIPDGTYRWTLEATDAWGNGPLRDAGTFTVDTTRPEVSVTDAEGDIPLFTPNGDGASDTIRFAVDASEPGTVTATVRDAADGVVDRVTASVVASGATIAWDGRDEDGAYAPDGEYALYFVARDRAGNRSEAQVRAVVAYGALGYSATSQTVFFPQDGDRLGRTTTFSFRLRSAAAVTWTVQDAGGNLVRTIRDAAPLAAGSHAYTWNGRNDAGAMVARGTYRSVVTATDGTFAATQRASVVADAFRITASDTTPGRGQRVTITATSAEKLDGLPRLRIYQPGIKAWTVKMTKVDGKVYRVTIRLKSSRTGTLRLRVLADDATGAGQSSNLTLTLH
jgi:flagellar hook assembly protein FlgD